eukprot:scaffold78349_cov38-Phaeocystis_antarctica.AAC.1
MLATCVVCFDDPNPNPNPNRVLRRPEALHRLLRVRARGCMCRSMVKVAPCQRPSSAPAPPQGAPDGPGWLSASRGEAGPLGAQLPPRVLELAASQAAHLTAFDHSGADCAARTLTLTPNPNP